MTSLSARIEEVVQKTLPRLRQTVEQRTCRVFAAHIVIKHGEHTLFDQPVGSPDQSDNVERAGQYARANCQPPHRPRVFWSGGVETKKGIIVSVSGTEMFDSTFAKLLAQEILPILPATESTTDE